MAFPGSILNSDPNISPRNKNNCGYSHGSSPFPSSTAVILLGNAAPGGSSALRIKKDDLVWLILSPGGGEPSAHCVGKRKKRIIKELLHLPDRSVCGTSVPSFSTTGIGISPAEERGDTHYSISAFRWEEHEATIAPTHETLHHDVKTHLAIVALDPDVAAPPPPELQLMPWT